MIGQKLLHYRIESLLGHGGMGEVYLAHDEKLDRKVAVKFFSAKNPDETQRARFRREAVSASRLNHNNIVAIHAVETVGDRDFIVMEYVDGDSLRTVMDRGPMPVEQALGMAKEIAAALGAAHEAGVVHRDVKPENIMVTREGQAKVLDFGLAVMDGDTRLTTDDSTVGTAAYMSPEQARGDQVDAHSDVFSLGVVVYEMLSGKRPFRGEKLATLVYNIVNEPATPLSDHVSLPDGVEEMVDRLMNKSPDRRPKNGIEARDEIATFTSSDPSVQLSSVRAAPRPKRVGLWPVVVLLAVVAFAALFWWRGRDGAGLASNPSTTEPAMAVMYFENLADPEDTRRLNDVLTNLVLTQLSNDGELRVVSRQLLLDVLHNGDFGETIRVANAKAIASKAKAHWMLSGQVVQAEPSFELTVQVVEVGTGDVVVAERVSGSDDIFAAAEAIAATVRAKIGATPASSTFAAAPRATTSEAAYRLYTKAISAGDQNMRYEMVRLLKEALAIDSTFVLAHSTLSAPGNQMHLSEQRYHAEKAMELIDRAPVAFQYRIRSLYRFYQGDTDAALAEMLKMAEFSPDDKSVQYDVGAIYLWEYKNCDESIKHFRKALELDPQYGLAYNAIAYAHAYMLRFQDAVIAIDRYLEIEDVANAWDTKGEIYSIMGRVEEAKAAFEKAVELEPTFKSHRDLATISYVDGDREQAEQHRQLLLRNPSPTVRAQARFLTANFLAMDGKLEAALAAVIAAERRNEQDGKPWNMNSNYYKAMLNRFMGNNEAMLRAAEASNERIVRAAREEASQWAFDIDYVESLCVAGKIDEARALLDSAPESSRLSGETRADVDFGYGLIAMAEEDYDAAVNHFRASAEGSFFFWRHYFLARALHSAGQLAEAVDVYERILLDRSTFRWGDPVHARLLHYYAGRAFEDSGWSSRAQEQYQILVDAWADADTELDELRDARARLERLRQGS